MPKKIRYNEPQIMKKIAGTTNKGKINISKRKGPFFRLRRVPEGKKQIALLRRIQVRILKKYNAKISTGKIAALTEREFSYRRFSGSSKGIAIIDNALEEINAKRKEAEENIRWADKEIRTGNNSEKARITLERDFMRAQIEYKQTLLLEALMLNKLEEAGEYLREMEDLKDKLKKPVSLVS